jgi:hypothetical protein
MSSTKSLNTQFIQTKDGYQLEVCLYNDGSYTVHYKDDSGEVKEQGEGWHEDMGKLGYKISDEDRIGIIKLKGGGEYHIFATLKKSFDAYPEEKDKCIIN